MIAVVVVVRTFLVFFWCFRCWEGTETTIPSMMFVLLLLGLVYSEKISMIDIVVAVKVVIPIMRKRRDSIVLPVVIW